MKDLGVKWVRFPHGRFASSKERHKQQNGLFRGQMTMRPQELTFLFSKVPCNLKDAHSKKSTELTRACEGYQLILLVMPGILFS